MSSLTRPGLAAALLAALTVHAPPAAAMDGAFEINQACVSVGCFVGDSAGFPVELAQPGTYVLTSNLVVPAIDTSGILVNSSNATIELQGFRIVGPASCAGEPVMCAGGGVGGVGIDGWSGGNIRNVIARNGTVTGFFTGMLVSFDGRAEDMLLIGNIGQGSRARSGSTLLRCTASTNGIDGLEGFRIIDSTSTGNGRYGFALGDGSVLRDSTARDNGGDGVYDFGPSLIANVNVYSNAAGIYVASGGTLITGSVISGNTGTAIFTQSGMVAATVVSNTVSTGNAGGLEVQWGGGGILIQIGENVCGTDKVCP